MIKRRLSRDCLIFLMGKSHYQHNMDGKNVIIEMKIPILVRWHLHIEMLPWAPNQYKWLFNEYRNFFCGNKMVVKLFASTMRIPFSKHISLHWIRPHITGKEKMWWHEMVSSLALCEGNQVCHVSMGPSVFLIRPKSPKLKCFSSGLAVVFAQSTEARC